MSRSLWTYCICYLLGFLFSQPVFALVYDWVPLGRNDIQIINNPRVQYQIQAELIRQAESSIEMITYDLRTDGEVGFPVLRELRAAALERKVLVRFAYDVLPDQVFDKRGILLSKLEKIAQETPYFQYIPVSGPEMIARGWKSEDAIHEKLLVIDERIAMTTGRGQAAQYLRWLDTAFVFKGPLANQSTVAFNVLWETLLIENPSRRAQLGGIEKAPVLLMPAKLAALPEESLVVELFPNDLRELKFLTHWIHEEASYREDYRARIIHYDFFHQLRNLPQVKAGKKKPKDYSFQKRLKKLIDPVVNRVVHELKTARQMKLATLAVIPHPHLKKALIQKLEDSHFHLEIFTNSKRSHENIAPFHLPLPIGWDANLPSLDDLLKYPGASGFTLDPTQHPNSPVYLHRKLVIINRDPALSAGREDTVFFGSHNLTFASTTTVDEMAFQVESNEFAERASRIFDEDANNFGIPINKIELHKERKDHRIAEWFSQFFDFLY